MLVNLLHGPMVIYTGSRCSLAFVSGLRWTQREDVENAVEKKSARAGLAASRLVESSNSSLRYRVAVQLRLFSTHVFKMFHIFIIYENIASFRQCKIRISKVHSGSRVCTDFVRSCSLNTFFEALVVCTPKVL